MPTHTDTNVNQLVINKMTKAQYESITPSDTELYLVPDEIDSTPTSGSTNPVTSDGVYTALDGKIDKPSTAGTNGQVLTSDGQGGQSWQTPTSSVSDVTVGGTSVVTNGVAAVPAIPDVTGKADKVSSPVNGNFAALDANGNLTDSGHKHSDYLTSHQDLSNYVQKSQTAGLLKNDGTVDTNTYITQHQDISGKADKVVYVDASTPPSTMDANKVYQYGTLSGNTTFPAFTAVASGDTEVKIWCWTFTTPSTAPTITWPAGITAWNGGSAPTINASKFYEVSVMDGLACIIES